MKLYVGHFATKRQSTFVFRESSKHFNTVIRTQSWSRKWCSVICVIYSNKIKFTSKKKKKKKKKTFSSPKKLPNYTKAENTLQNFLFNTEKYFKKDPQLPPKEKKKKKNNSTCLFQH